MSNIQTVDLVCSAYEPTKSEHTNATVVLLHPFPFDARLWHSVALQLAMRGWKVVVPNLRGCGASPAGDQEPSIQLLAADVWAALDSQKVDQPILVGISLGGYVVMEMMRQRPTSMSGIGLVDTKATADTEEGKAHRRAVAQDMRVSGDVKTFASGMLGRLIADQYLNDDSGVAPMVSAWINDAHPMTIAWLQEAMADRPDSVATLSAFKGRALLVRGSEDAVCSADDYDVMRQALPEADYVEIAGAGHLPPVENPLEMSNILSTWLNATV